MKRIVQLLASALVLTVSAAPASSFNMTASLSWTVSEAVEASRAHANPAPLIGGADYAISTFDNGVVKAFSKAWRRSGNGVSDVEGVVLILRTGAGGHIGRDMGSTNEHKRFTFRWHPATIAIVHTHPNSSEPRPYDDDILVANKYHVPIFTITNRGMFVYDPLIRKTSQVVDNLDWLDASKFRKAFGKQ
jgi:hypothetical protein